MMLATTTTTVPGTQSQSATNSTQYSTVLTPTTICAHWYIGIVCTGANTLNPWYYRLPVVSRFLLNLKLDLQCQAFCPLFLYVFSCSPLLCTRAQSESERKKERESPLPGTS